MKSIEQIESELKKPFPFEDLEFRIARCGLKKDGKPWAMALTYIDARAVMDRLDEVVGINGWKDSYRREGNATICSLSLKVKDEWITKEDAADDSDIEAVKGGISGSLKRAFVKWGGGRYLYNLTESFAVIVDKNVKGSRRGEAKDQQGNKVEFFWVPSPLPDWALPSKEEENKVVQEKTLESKTRLDNVIAKTQEVKVPDLTEVPLYISLVKYIEEMQDLETLQDFWKKNIVTVNNMPENERAAIVKAKDLAKQYLTNKALGK